MKNPSLKFSLLYSLWHKQTSTYALPHIDVPDILKCLTDALSLPQILSERMASRLCQFPFMCQDSVTLNVFGMKSWINKNILFVEGKNSVTVSLTCFIVTACYHILESLHGGVLRYLV